MNIVHIATRMKHHSPHSGYDRLSHFMSCERFDGSFIFKRLGLIPDRVWGLLLRKSYFYMVPQMKREIELQIKTLFYKNTIFHFLYGENDFRRFYPVKKNKLFITFHLPPNKYIQYFGKPPKLKKFNAIIVVSLNQIEYFKKWIPEEKIVFIPHGIDTNFYRPAQNGIKKDEILFVGTHLRDFEVLRRVIEKIEKLCPEISFTIVTFKENWKIFHGAKNIKLYDGITESQLLHFYQSHKILFLPLIDGTANNTLLEAASCGLPIITTNVGGIKDYLDNECAILIDSKKIDLIVTNIIDLIKDERKREELSTKARSRMLLYDWKIIASRMETVYWDY